MKTVQDVVTETPLVDDMVDDDDLLVGDVVVLVRVVDKETGEERLVVGRSLGCGLMVQMAMVVMANDILRRFESDD